MYTNHAVSQTEKQTPSVSIKAVELRYLPLYELIMGIAFGLIALISATALIGGFISGSIQFNSDLVVVLAACFIGGTLAILVFSLVARSWLRVRIQEDIELHWWLRRVTTQMPLTNAQKIHLDVYISPIFGMRCEVILTLMINDESVELPVLRHLLPLKSFRLQAEQFAEALQLPLHIPDRDRIPLGFRNAFDDLRTENINTDQSASFADKLLRASVTWAATDDAELQYRLTFEGRVCEIRVNDWPEYETVYSLLIAKEFVRDLPSLPDNWQLPQC